MASSVHTIHRGLRGVQSLRPRSRPKLPGRPFSTTFPLQTEKRPDEKDEIFVGTNEYSKSGYDQQAAQLEDTAFTKGRDAPDEQLRDAEYESKQIGLNSNPLDVSPANRDVSKMSERRPEEDAKQTKGPGQGSAMRTPPKQEELGRYDPSAGIVKGGTGSELTRKDEKPGPAFAGTRGR